MSTDTTDERTFTTTAPGSGEPLGSYPLTSGREVDAAVIRARAAAAWWRDLGFAGRRQRLLELRTVLTRRIEQLAELVHAETGKPHVDARLEIVLAIEHVAWAARNAPRYLGLERRSPGLLMANQQAYVEHRPVGVVGVIGPWNYPVFTPLGSIAYALAAGNAVVFKPSEFTPGVGVWLAERFAEIVPEHPVFQVITGRGETGTALAHSSVDKLAFTGSTSTAKKVMAACAERLTPVVLECGGKDALIVDADADLPAAAEAATWGAFANAGQTCIGIERVFVHERVYHRFCDLLTEQARSLRAGPLATDEIGPMTMPSQVGVVARHVDGALQSGGHALTGGPVDERSRFLQPTVLVDVPDDAPANTAETFGPTVTVASVADMDEAVRRANSTAYGLGSAVFSRRNGPAIAARLRAGMTSVNSVLAFAGMPALPFGGVGDSGFGRIHGPEGLREFTVPHSITVQRFRPPLALTTFERSERGEAVAGLLVGLLHGGSVLSKRLRRD